MRCLESVSVCRIARKRWKVRCGYIGAVRPLVGIVIIMSPKVELIIKNASRRLWQWQG